MKPTHDPKTVAPVAHKPEHDTDTRLADLEMRVSALESHTGIAGPAGHDGKPGERGPKGERGAGFWGGEAK